MAGMGRVPGERTRQPNRDRLAPYGVTVHQDDDIDAPELPGWENYRTETLRWYNTWCSAPQAAAFTVTDWQRLHMLAPLVDAYWAKPSVQLLAEIRLNESLLGATPVDRIRARIKLDRAEPRPAAPDGVADLAAARRRRLLEES